MAPPKFNKGEAVSSRMAIETKAISTTSANPKYKKPKPRIPTTDPKQIQKLWFQVRKQKRGDMTPAPSGKPKFVTGTRASESATRSGVGSTAATSKSQSTNVKDITINHPRFNELWLIPRGISIDPDTVPIRACLHFHTEPSSDTHLAGLGNSTLWLGTQDEFLDKVSKEYTFMNIHQLCEAEYASFAKEYLLKREPREGLSDNTKDSKQRFPRAERMLEFVCKPDDISPKSKWQAPPLLPPFQGSQNYPLFAFDIGPDCNYWITFHAFNSDYSGETKVFVYAPQNRMTCPYFTVEFKREDTDAGRAKDQVATFGALALYNRYLLRHRVPFKEWTHQQECQLRHYALTIVKSSYTFWCIRPKLKYGEWNGCNMDMISVGDLEQSPDVKKFVSWINEIHRWGLKNHIESCQTDIGLLAQGQDFRTSPGVLEKECTCGDSPDAAGTSEQETLHQARAPAGTEAAPSKPLALLACTGVDGSKIQGRALNGAALADPAKTAAEADGVAKPISQTPVDQQTGDKDAFDDEAAADDRNKVLEDEIETLGDIPVDAYLLVVDGVDGQPKPQHAKLNLPYATWCNKLGVKMGEKIWYYSVSNGPPTIIDDESSYETMMRIARFVYRLYLLIGNDNN